MSCLPVTPYTTGCTCLSIFTPFSLIYPYLVIFTFKCPEFTIIMCHIHPIYVFFYFRAIGQFIGHKGQLAPRCRALDAMIKKFYHGIQKAVHPFRLKNFEHLLLGSGRNQNLRPGCRRHLARTFHTPLSHSGLTHLHFSESAVQITAKVGIKFLCLYSRCFGSYFDLIFLMYLSVFWLFFQANLILIIILIDPV